MKNYTKAVLALITTTMFIGCNGVDNIDIRNSFSKGSKLLCYHKQPTGSGRLANARHVDKVLVDKHTYMIVNKNKNIVINDLSAPEYNIDDCSVLNNKDIFELDDGKYILINGIAQKMPREVIGTGR